MTFNGSILLNFIPQIFCLTLPSHFSRCPCCTTLDFVFALWILIALNTMLIFLICMTGMRSKCIVCYTQSDMKRTKFFEGYSYPWGWNVFLIHRIRILTNNVYSMMPRPKKLEIRKTMRICKKDPNHGVMTLSPITLS
jgi:hypothetical protein